MKQIRKRLTYANVMSSIAVFLVLGGATAFAATQLAKNSVGAKQLKKNAVTTAKVKKEAITAAKIKNAAVDSSKLGANAVTSEKLGANAVTSEKLADSAVTTNKLTGDAVTNGKLAADSVSTGKVANEAVTAAKLAASERSEASQTWEDGLLNTEMVTGLFGSYATGTSAISTNLPVANYVVTASTELINSAIEPRTAVCRLFDDGSEVGEGSAVIGEGILVAQGTITITGISDGGALNLRCRASGDDIFAFDRKITAIRVGTVTQ